MTVPAPVGSPAKPAAVDNHLGGTAGGEYCSSTPHYGRVYQYKPPAVADGGTKAKIPGPLLENVVPTPAARRARKRDVAGFFRTTGPDDIEPGREPAALPGRNQPENAMVTDGCGITFSATGFGAARYIPRPTRPVIFLNHPLRFTVSYYLFYNTSVRREPALPDENGKAARGSMISCRPRRRATVGRQSPRTSSAEEAGR